MAYEQRVGKDRFGNDQVLKRLKAPKSDKRGYGKGKIEGLHVAYFEHKGQTFKLTVSGLKDEKDERHTGWISITAVKQQQGGKW